VRGGVELLIILKIAYSCGQRKKDKGSNRLDTIFVIF